MLKKYFRIIFVCVVVLANAVPISTSFAATATSTTTITTTVAETISLSCGATAALGTLTAGTPVSTTTTCTTTTNANGGYDLAVKRDDADTTIDHTVDAAANITDKAAWTPGTPNGVVWAGTGLGFRVNTSGTTAGLFNSTFWGTDDTAPNAKFAGFPTAYANIASSSAYSSTSTAVVVQVKADVPGTQKSGTYDGTVTFQATSKP